MNSYKIFINGQEIHNATFPFKYGKLLDEQLDYATVTLSRINVKCFKPRTPVRVEITSKNTANGERYEQKKIFNYVIANDNFRETPVHSGYYKHDLTLIEPTKLTENPLETLCFTNAGGRDFIKEPKTPYIIITKNTPEASYAKIKPVLPSDFLSPTSKKEITLPSPRAFMDVSSVYVIWGTVEVVTPSGTKIFEFSDEGTSSKGSSEDEITIDLPIGITAVHYNTGFRQVEGAASSYEFEASFSIARVDSHLPLKLWTIRDVINRTLELEQPLLWDTEKKDYVRPPRFKFAYPAPQYEVQTETVNVQPTGALIIPEDGETPYFVVNQTFSSVLSKPLTVAKIVEKSSALFDLSITNTESGFTITGKSLTRASGTVAVKLVAEYFIDSPNKKVFEKNAPEFTFTRQTLREALQTIGGYIHAEPRLIFNEVTEEFDTITYDFFGDQKYAEYFNVNSKNIERLCDYNYEDKRGGWGIEQACNALDGYVDNLVNRLRAGAGTVGQPYEGGSQTLRTDVANLRLEEGNMYLPTAYPIEEIQAVYWIDPDEGTKHNISPYIYEENIYNSQLSSYDSVYPTSKAYGLYYTQGQTGIHGFFFKNKEITNGALAKYAIVNILELASGQNVAENIGNYRSLQFEVVYVPIYSARVAHTKQYLGDFLQYPATLNYSQSANSVETQFYGENIKGAVERIGTPEETYTFACRNIDTIPEAGQLWDDEYYISTVFVECVQDRFKVTVGLSKNFNRKSQYVGVSSYKRIYEVSERMVQSRESLYRDYLVISRKREDFEPPLQEDCLVENDLLAYVITTFTQSGFSIEENGSLHTERVAVVLSQGKTKNDTPLNAVLLPVIASAEGNIIEFSWEYKDNFSAGLQAIEYGESVYSNEVQYSDYYGRMYYEFFKLGKGLNTVDDDQAKKYPQYQHSAPESVYTTGKYRLIKRKDSRESLKNNIALQFVTTEKDFIIGSALAANNPMVAGVSIASKAKLYILNNRINKFSKEVDVNLANGNIAGVLDLPDDWFMLDTEKKMVVSSALTAGTSGKAWCYATPIYYGEAQEVEDEDGNVETITPELGGELLIGCNMDIDENDMVGGIQIYGVHDIYEFLKNKQ